MVNGSPGAVNTGLTQKLITNILVRLIQRVVIKEKLFSDPFHHQILLFGGRGGVRRAIIG